MFTHFRSIWDDVFTEANIKAGFKKTGLCPVDRTAYPEAVFNPDLLTLYKTHHAELYEETPVHKPDNPMTTPSKQQSPVPQNESLAKRPRLLFNEPTAADRSLNEDIHSLNESDPLNQSMLHTRDGAQSQSVSIDVSMDASTIISPLTADPSPNASTPTPRASTPHDKT